MSTGVANYSVSPERLRAVPGSKDQNLLDSASRLTDYFQTIDDIAEEEYEDEDEDVPRPPSCSETLRQIVAGEEYDDRFGYLYFYAYEAICLLVGTDVGPEWSQISRSTEYFKHIDATLEQLGFKLKIRDLYLRGPLFALPEPEMFPYLGWWTAEEIAEALGVFRSLDRAGPKGPLSTLDRSMAEAVSDIRTWIESASEESGNWLIGVEC